MCQLEMNFDNKVDYDDVINTFSKLTLTKQRKLLDYFFDYTEKEDKFENRIYLNKQIGIAYDNIIKHGSLDSMSNSINSLNKDLFDFMESL
jgi:hypothetical protein